MSEKAVSAGVKRNRYSALYRNVLNFPTGTDHLKYFDRNPHPDRISDRDLAIWEAARATDLNPPLIQRQMEFGAVKSRLEPFLSDMERRIMRLPDKMQEWVDNAVDEETRMKGIHLRDCFYNYLSTPLDEDVIPDIQWLEYEFAMKHLGTYNALRDLKENILNHAAKEKLVEKLAEAGAFAIARFA